MATTDPPPKMKKEKESMSTKFIKLVDAQFLEYDQPLTLAIVIGGLTLVGLIIVLVVTLTSVVTTTSASKTYPQYVGAYHQQWLWYDKVVGETTRETEIEGSSSETTVKTELCIERISAEVPEPDCEVNRPGASGSCTGTYNKAMKFMANVAGQLGIPSLEACWPGDSFMNGHNLDTSVEPAVWGATPNAQLTLRSGETKTLPTFSFCPGIEASYYVEAQVPDPANPGQMVASGRTGGTAIRALTPTELTEVTCPPVNNQNGPIPWIVEYKQTITTTIKVKKSLVEALGIAFAYSTRIQVFFTVLIVNVMLLCKCLKRDGSQEIAKVSPSAEQGP